MNALQWKQPAAYRRALYREYRRTNPLIYWVCSGWLFAILLAFGGNIWSGVHSTPFYWSTYVLCALIGSQLACPFLPLTNPADNVTIVISNESVRSLLHAAFRTVPIEVWPWEQIARFRVTDKVIAGKSFPVLVVESWEGRQMATFGLNQCPTVAEIAEWLKHVDRELVDETEIQSAVLR